MPPALANARKRGLAKAHFEFMAEDEPHNQIFPITSCAFTTCERGGKNVRRMGRVLLPVDVVVIHAADHERVGQRRRDWIHALACTNYGGRTRTGYLVEHFEHDLDIVLLIAAQGATDRVEQKALGLVCGILRHVFAIQGRGPARHGGGYGFVCFFNRQDFSCLNSKCRPCTGVSLLPTSTQDLRPGLSYADLRADAEV